MLLQFVLNFFEGCSVRVALPQDYDIKARYSRCRCAKSSLNTVTSRAVSDGSARCEPYSALTGQSMDSRKLPHFSRATGENFFEPARLESANCLVTGPPVGGAPSFCAALVCSARQWCAYGSEIRVS